VAALLSLYKRAGERANAPGGRQYLLTKQSFEAKVLTASKAASGGQVEAGSSADGEVPAGEMNEQVDVS